MIPEGNPNQLLSGNSLIQHHNKPADEKADSTLRASRAVPHPSTDRALRRLTSEVRRDPVHSTRYGRQRKQCLCILHDVGGPSKHASTVLRNLDAVLCCVAVCYHKYMDA